MNDAVIDDPARSGGCLCGHVRYRFIGDPLMVAVCHCRHCQKQSGSAFSLVCVVTDTQYRQEGETRVFQDRGDSGSTVDRHFCTHCGSPITSIAGILPGLTIIKAGTLDDPSPWRPAAEAYCSSALAWLTPLAADRYPRSNIG
jgi:hypothetical protein